MRAAPHTQRRQWATTSYRTRDKVVFSYSQSFTYIYIYIYEAVKPLCRAIDYAPWEGIQNPSAMIYDVNSPLFRSFLSQKGGSAADKR